MTQEQPLFDEVVHVNTEAAPGEIEKLTEQFSKDAEHGVAGSSDSLVEDHIDNCTNAGGADVGSAHARSKEGLEQFQADILTSIRRSIENEKARLLGKIANDFASHRADELGQQKMATIRKGCYILAQVMVETVPSGDDLTAALEHLELVMFKANAGISRVYPTV